MSFSVLGLLPSIASTLSYNLAYSGQAGSVWGWVVAGLAIQCVALGMAELCSSMPTAGGLYYASAVLAPEGWGPFASWVRIHFMVWFEFQRANGRNFKVCGLVELPGFHDWTVFSQLRFSSNDPGSGLHWKSRLRSPNLASIPALPASPDC